jgi:hypothetical protein
MKRGTSRRSAVVGDRRPLERNLARFLLEERGFVVAMETATAADTARAVEQLRPDVVLVHEDVAAEPGSSLIRDIRTASGSTRLILLTSDRAAADPTLLASADAVVEEGPGLTELEAALTVRPARAVAGAIPFAAAARRPPAARSERRWVERLQGAAAASIIVLAIVLARGVGVPGPDATGEAGEHVAATEQALESLAEELGHGLAADPEQVQDLARDLLAEYSTAIALGASEDDLSADILAALSPLIDDLPDDVLALLTGILGDALVYGGSPSDIPSPSPAASPRPEPAPTPPVAGEPSPEPSPEVSEAPAESPEPELSPPAEGSPSPTETGTQSPSPTETESPTPTETETESPSPSASESPSPTQTETPSPTQTETPSPTQTETPSPTQTETPSPTDTGAPEPTKSEDPDPSKSYSPPPPKPTDECRSGPDPCGSSGSTTAGTIYAVPPGLVLLLLTSGLARRRSKRRSR